MAEIRYSPTAKTIFTDTISCANRLQAASRESYRTMLPIATHFGRYAVLSVCWVGPTRISLAKTAEPIKMSLGNRHVLAPKHALNRRHQANTIERSACGGDAALCRLTSTTFANYFMVQVMQWVCCVCARMITLEQYYDPDARY